LKQFRKPFDGTINYLTEELMYLLSTRRYMRLNAPKKPKSSGMSAGLGLQPV
jgi:hypothetical protein